MKNLPKEKRDKLILIALGTLAVVVGLYYGMISSQRKKLVNSARIATEQENKLSSAERMISSRAQIEKNLENALGNLKSIEGTMASGDIYSWAIQTINSFKENYDVEIPQFSREVQTDVGMYVKYPYKAVAFHLRGTALYRDFGKFVADFENAFPYMRIQNIELDPAVASNATAQQNKEKLAFKMEIVALVKP